MGDIFRVPDECLPYIIEDPVHVLEQERRFRNIMQINKLMGIITTHLETYCSLGKKIGSTFEEIARCLSEMDTITHDDSYSSLKGMLDIINGGFQCHFDTVKRQIMQDITNFVNKDFAQLQKFHDNHEKIHDAYRTSQEKYVALTSKEIDKQASEDPLIDAHAQNAISYFDYTSKMENIELQFQILIPSILTNFISSVCDPMKFVLGSIDCSKPSIDKCSARISEFSRRFSELASSTAKSKQILTGSLPGFWEHMRSPFPGTQSRNMQGYLWKKCGRLAVSWKRRFFIISNCILTYSKSVEDIDRKPQDISLLYSSVRADPSAARPHCFTIQTKERSYTFQALTEWDMKHWLAVIQNNIFTELNNNNKPQGRGIRRHSSGSVMLKYANSLNLNSTESGTFPLANDAPILTGSSDRFSSQFSDDIIEEEISSLSCADCGQTNASWVSLNTGISLCDACAGIHRGLPLKISRVKNLTLDTLDRYQRLSMEAVGSSRANRVLEFNLDKSKKITPNSSQQERIQFIQDKYCNHKFINGDSINIIDAIQNEDIDQTLEWTIAGGMDTYYIDGVFTPLHAAAIVGNPIIFQILMYGTDKGYDILDDASMTAMNYAAAHGNLEIVDILLRSGAKVCVNEKYDALSIATVRGHTDIVDLLEHICPFNGMDSFILPHPEIKPIYFDVNKFVDHDVIEERKTNARRQRRHNHMRDSICGDKDKLLSVIGSMKEANSARRSAKELPHIDLIPPPEFLKDN